MHISQKILKNFNAYTLQTSFILLGQNLCTHNLQKLSRAHLHVKINQKEPLKCVPKDSRAWPHSLASTEVEPQLPLRMLLSPSLTWFKECRKELSPLRLQMLISQPVLIAFQLKPLNPFKCLDPSDCRGYTTCLWFSILLSESTCCDRYLWLMNFKLRLWLRSSYQFRMENLLHGVEWLTDSW